MKRNEPWAEASRAPEDSVWSVDSAVTDDAG